MYDPSKLTGIIFLVLNSNTVYFSIIFAQFGPKRDAVTGEWRKLHNEELHNL
jgi:hypothetical protein